MKTITIKKAKHICAVPACKCTDTVKVSGSPNLLGGLYLCALHRRLHGASVV